MLLKVSKLVFSVTYSAECGSVILYFFYYTGMNGRLLQNEEEWSVIPGGMVCYTRMRRNGLLYQEEWSVIPGGMVCHTRMRRNGLLYQEELSVIPG